MNTKTIRREITVTPSTGALVGYCNGCNDSRAHHPVWNVELGSLSFRVCSECRDEMIAKLGRR